MKKIVSVFLFICALNAQLQAQTKEIKLNLNEQGSQYVKFTFLNQTWLRWNQSNPGTLVNGEPTDQTFDIGLRRTRMQLFGQLSSHVFFYTQFGMNNFNYLSQNAGNRKLQAFFHDALGEYVVFAEKNYLKLGGGLTIANGLSRFSQPSIGTIMTLDVPVFAQATVEQTDEFSRKLSFYARGQIGKIDYRIALSDPFPITTNGQTPPPLSENATFSQYGHTKQYQGFLIYNFLEKEPHTTPYMTGTYLGKKRILNLEAGIIAQPKATWSLENADTVYHNLMLWSVAAYLDTPLGDSQEAGAISAYLGYFNTDYGPGYIRNNGIMNPANGIAGEASFNGAGNAYPMFGTGNVIYGQVGYKLKDNLLGQHGTLMPYASVQSAQFDRLSNSATVFDLGVNWLLDGHTSKISLDYQRRPVFDQDANGDIEKSNSLGSVVLQYQVYI